MQGVKFSKKVLYVGKKGKRDFSYSKWSKVKNGMHHQRLLHCIDFWRDSIIFASRYIQLNKLSEPMIDVWQSRSAAIASLQQQLRCVNHINENSMQNANVISIKNITDHLFLL